MGKLIHIRLSSRAVTAAIYSIGAVARMLGVPAATLRTWEERYGVVMPDRSLGGHRLYTRDHVEQLRFILRSIEEGMQPADAHRLLTDRLSDDPGGKVAIGGSETRLVIMLAERDPHAAELAEYFLRTEGYETFMALEAREAEVVFEERSPHLAVVDLLTQAGRGRVSAEPSGNGERSFSRFRRWSPATRPWNMGLTRSFRSPSTPCSSCRPSRICSDRTRSCEPGCSRRD